MQRGSASRRGCIRREGLPGGPVAFDEVDGAGRWSGRGIEDDEAGGDAVDEEAVVGDDDDGAGEVDEGAFDDLDEGNVQVIGRLVSRRTVRAGEERLGEGDAGLERPRACRCAVGGRLQRSRAGTEASDLAAGRRKTSGDWLTAWVTVLERRSAGAG